MLLLAPAVAHAQATAFADVVRMTVSGTPGTGTITLGSATTGYQSDTNAGMTNGATYAYYAYDPTGGIWEFGYGTYNSSAHTITRNPYYGSSGPGTAVTLTATATVGITIGAEDINALLSDIASIESGYAALSGSLTNGNIVEGAGSGSVKDTGIAIGNVPTMASNAGATGDLITSNGANKTLAAASILATNVPTMASNAAASGNVLSSAGANKTVQDSAIATANLATMASNAAGAGNLIESAGANKSQADSGVAAANVATLSGTQTISGNKTYSGKNSFAQLNVKVRTASSTSDTITTADYLVCADNASAAATENLPASPSTGDTYLIKDCSVAAGTNNITITPASGNIDGAATFVMSTNGQSAAVTYTGSQWSIN
ncbi:hypothetical protein CWB41_14060 [Methylovirgula ligni]|uniref:hypothetical protein n=1 Tax=Methylovirgula ligni TaxID=569860 RepID=UPI000E2307E5|nr:hypothetical protein [Methylovirgula ligni]QAY96718.1 hypothetical protein CWB41_14060 [Methylovirgula ligni]